MVQQVINIGSAPNDATGDPLRTAFNKINQNFQEIYAVDPVGANFDFSENSMRALNSNGNVSLEPNGTGNVILSNIIFPNTDGTAGYVLRTDGAGTLYWYAPTAVAAGVEDLSRYRPAVLQHMTATLSTILRLTCCMHLT